EMALMQINADIVKLDISFVHNVDTDPDKQALIQNLIRYARERGIAVLAEGVETREEMRTLIRFGVDYLQGYYLGAPQYQPMNPDKMLRREIRRIAGRADAGPDIPAP
ncbi:MAG: EAL domain-containing protein, partial [Candidatus Limiplasma sp.]|nr:EAL domain-containing protein [Candidatus Limiplasma sp.]